MRNLKLSINSETFYCCRECFLSGRGGGGFGREGGGGGGFRGGGRPGGRRGGGGFRRGGGEAGDFGPREGQRTFDRLSGSDRTLALVVSLSVAFALC